MSNIPYKNKECYADPTAYHALTEIEKAHRAKVRANRAIREMKYIADAAGFDILNRIELFDRESGICFK